MDERSQAAETARRRMGNVGLTGPRQAGYAEAIGHLGAVQAQDYGPAKWALAQRIEDNADAVLEQAFSDGKLIRTHVLRPTWHFVRPEDLRWMLELTAPRVHAFNRYYYRKEELDAALHRRCEELIAAELQGRNHLTRKEIGAVLERSGVQVSAMRVTLLLMHAELEGLICSGPRRGKQQTYALIDERVHPARPMDRDEALAELTRRYFTSHGPATVKDFQWWSSLSVPDIRQGLEAVGDALSREVLDGITYWSADSAPTRKREEDRVRLIQSYDEYVVGYTESKYLLDLSGAARARPDGRGVFNQIILLGSQVAGCWRPTPTRTAVRIDAILDAPFDRKQHRALAAAAQEYAEFVGLEAELNPQVA